MNRWIGIDFGEKRIGIAVTDPFRIISYPLQTVDHKTIILFLKNYILTNKVEKIIVGFPRNLDGSLGNSSVRVKKFKSFLAREFPLIEILLYDERFTSKIAARDMILYGISKKERRDKSNIDKISAAIILQSYMDFHGRVNIG